MSQSDSRGEEYIIIQWLEAQSVAKRDLWALHLVEPWSYCKNGQSGR